MNRIFRTLARLQKAAPEVKPKRTKWAILTISDAGEVIQATFHDKDKCNRKLYEAIFRSNPEYSLNIIMLNGKTKVVKR
jgi:hypothetical protein